jgi:hypothetical protein
MVQGMKVLCSRFRVRAVQMSFSSRYLPPRAIGIAIVGIDHLYKVDVLLAEHKRAGDTENNPSSGGDLGLDRALFTWLDRRRHEKGRRENKKDKRYRAIKNSFFTA